MTFQIAFEFSKFEQLARGKESRLRPGRVKQRSGMSFRKDEPIVVRVMGIFRVITHVSKEQCRHQIRGRATGSRMSAARSRRRGNGMNAELVGDPRKSFNRF